MRWYSLFRLYPIWHIYLSFLFCSGFMMVMMLIATSVVTNRQLCDQSPVIWSSTRPNTHQTLRSLHLVGTVHCRRPMQWYACFEHILFYTQTLYTRECTLVTTKIKNLHPCHMEVELVFFVNYFHFWQNCKMSSLFQRTSLNQRTMVMTMEMLKIPAMILWCQILQHQPSIDSLRAGLDLIKKKETLKDARRPDNPRRS